MDAVHIVADRSSTETWTVGAEITTAPGFSSPLPCHLHSASNLLSLEGLAAWEQIKDRPWHPATACAMKELLGHGHCDNVHPEQGLARWVAFVDGSFVGPSRTSGANASWAFVLLCQSWLRISFCGLPFGHG